MASCRQAQEVLIAGDDYARLRSGKFKLRFIILAS